MGVRFSLLYVFLLWVNYGWIELVLVWWVSGTFLFVVLFGVGWIDSWERLVLPVDLWFSDSVGVVDYL